MDTSMCALALWTMIVFAWVAIKCPAFLFGAGIAVIIPLWFLLMEIASTQVLIVVTLQLVSAALIFGNTFVVICQNNVFWYIVRPFDLGDFCMIDGVKMMVQEINLMRTVFLNSEKEKVYYPNTVFAKKTIMVCNGEKANLVVKGDS